MFKSTGSDAVAERSVTGTGDHVDSENRGAGEDLVDPESTDRLGSGHR